MTNTPPTLEELRQLGLTWIENARQQLIETRQVIPVIYLGDPVDGTASVLIGIDGNIMNSPAAKQDLVTRVKKEIGEHGYMHVVTVTDSYGMEVGKEDWLKIELLRRTFNLSLPDIAKAGFGEVTETVSVFIETVTSALVLQLKYHRGPDGNVESFDPVSELEGGQFSGRFKFF
jgi:hypothetical protein